MTSSSWLALVTIVNCFAPSIEVPSLPNETYVYPAAVFNATQQICSQENLRQGIINGIKQDSYRYIQNILSKSCVTIAYIFLNGNANDQIQASFLICVNTFWLSFIWFYTRISLGPTQGYVYHWSKEMCILL